MILKRPFVLLNSLTPCLFLLLSIAHHHVERMLCRFYQNQIDVTLKVVQYFLHHKAIASQKLCFGCIDHTMSTNES